MTSVGWPPPPEDASEVDAVALTGEVWLLVWGDAHTFNGRLVRFRVYAFDGYAFQTVWAPEDMLSATVTFTSTGFSIAHELRELPYELTDDYALTVDGVIKIG